MMQQKLYSCRQLHPSLKRSMASYCAGYVSNNGHIMKPNNHAKGTMISTTNITPTAAATAPSLLTNNALNLKGLNGFQDCPGRHMLLSTRSKVFVSRHNQSLNVTAEQITSYCSNHGLPMNELKTTNTHVVLRECPFCEKPTYDKADNQYKLYVQIGGGAYFCHRCGSKGSWYDFKMKLGGYEVLDSTGQPSMPNPVRVLQGGSKHTYSSSGGRNGQGRTQAPLPMPSKRLQAAYITELLDKPENPALDYLTNKRGLTKQTLRKYGVGLGRYNFPGNGNDGKWVKADCVTFPWIMKASEVHEQEVLRGSYFGDWKDRSRKGESFDASDDDYFVTRRLKARALEQKSWQRLDPPGGGWGLFGWHTVPDDSKEIVLTEGEYDAMAVYQATGRPSVSLPNGCRSLPVEVLPMLEKFEKVYLWMDNDGPGREGAEIFAKKIGVNRCLLIQPGPSVDGEPAPKDANEALLRGMDLEAMIQDSQVLPHDRIITFSEMRSQVLDEMLNPDQYAGVPIPSLPELTKILKGFRRGEVTVLTGPTGAGKTTFLGQLSLDFAENNVNTLWGSFEIKNTRLLNKLIKQYSRGPLPANMDERRQVLENLADRFENLPLYFMKFHGGSDIDDVIDAMDYAAYVHDVEHVILDNMQFMISRNSSKYNSSFDKYDIQDIAIEKFRKFATEKNIHVTLVVHPRKEDEGVKLGMSSVYGSAKATQEADNVLILQKDPMHADRKFVDVKKNRYDGTLGSCPLFFQRDSNRYSDVPDHSLPPKRNIRPTSPASAPRLVAVSNNASNGGRTFVSASKSTPQHEIEVSRRPSLGTYSSILED